MIGLMIEWNDNIEIKIETIYHTLIMVSLGRVGSTNVFSRITPNYINLG